MRRELMPTHMNYRFCFLMTIYGKDHLRDGQFTSTKIYFFKKKKSYAVTITFLKKMLIYIKNGIIFIKEKLNKNLLEQCVKVINRPVI